MTKAPCPACPRQSGFDGCSHVECPKRKPWGSADSDLEPIVGKDRPRTGKTNKLTEMGSEGSFRRVKHRGAP